MINLKLLLNTDKVGDYYGIDFCPKISFSVVNILEIWELFVDQTKIITLKDHIHCLHNT